MAPWKRGKEYARHEAKQVIPQWKYGLESLALVAADLPLTRTKVYAARILGGRRTYWMRFRPGSRRIGKIRLLAIAGIIAAVSMILIARWEKSGLPSGLVVHGAVQEVTMPPPEMLSGGVPFVFGWMQDGRLWTLGPNNTFLIAAPPYKNFRSFGMGKMTPKALQDPTVFLSPNGEWCGPRLSVGDHGPPDPLAWSLKGSHNVHSDLLPWTEWWAENWWKRDSSGIYSFMTKGDGQYRLHFTPISTAPSKKSRVETTGIQLPLNYEPHDDFGSMAVGEFPDGKLLIYTAEGSEQITTWIIDPSGKQEALQTTWTPFQPHHASVFSDPTFRLSSQLALAPDGKRLAWICHTERSPWYKVFLHDRLHIGKSPNPANICEVYVTDLQGRHDRLIGWVPGFERGAEEPLQQLKWLPDGRNISVLYKNKLYIIPAAS